MTSATEEKDGATGRKHQDRCRRARPRGSSHHAQRSHQRRQRPPLGLFPGPSLLANPCSEVGLAFGQKTRVTSKFNNLSENQS